MPYLIGRMMMNGEHEKRNGNLIRDGGQVVVEITGSLLTPVALTAMTDFTLHSQDGRLVTESALVLLLLVIFLLAHDHPNHHHQPMTLMINTDYRLHALLKLNSAPQLEENMIDLIVLGMILGDHGMMMMIEGTAADALTMLTDTTVLGKTENGRVGMRNGNGKKKIEEQTVGGSTVGMQREIAM
jgi:hypothetical protein